MEDNLISMVLVHRINDTMLILQSMEHEFEKRDSSGEE